MNTVDDSFDDLFDFDPIDKNDQQDVSLIADQHLFDGGPGLFPLNSSVVNDESIGLPSFGFSNEQFTNGAPEDYIGLPTFDREFFENGTGGNFDADLVDLAPHDEPVSDFMAQPYEGLGLTYNSSLPNNLDLPPLLVEPAMLFERTQMFHHVVLATPEEEQQWQAFKNQQTHVLQPDQASQYQQTQPIQPWEDVGNGLGLNLQTPFEYPVNGPTSAGFPVFSEASLPQDLQQTPNLGQQAVLSDEQVHRLQHADSGEHVHPSAEVTPTNTSISPAESSPQTSRVSRGTSIRSHSSSSRIATPEPVPQQVPLPQTQPAELTFASLKDAEAAMPSRYIENAWESPSPDNTIPKTQDERAAYVLRMFQAFQDTSVCKDNKNGHSFVKRWKTRGYYDLKAMEKVCWHMLDIAEHLHSSGPSSTAMYCEEALKKLKGSRTLIFEQRINAICAMLRFSKYLCDQLMKGEGLEALVGAPKQKMSGATTMQVQNQRRQVWIVHGRTEVPIDEKNETNGNGASDAATQPAPPEKKSKAKRATPAKSRAIAKTRSSKSLRDDSSDDEDSVHRRQSETDIFTQPQQVFALKPSPDSRRAYPKSLASPSSRRGLQELRMVPSAVASSPTAPESPLSLTSLTRPSSATHGPFTAHPRAELDAGRARFVRQQDSGKGRKGRNAHPTTKHPATKTQGEASGTKGGATKFNTKTDPRKRLMDLTETDSENDEQAHHTKRQRKGDTALAMSQAPIGRFKVFSLRKTGHGDTHTVRGSREVGPGENHDVAEDEENDEVDEDENDGVEEDEARTAGFDSPSRSPSPIRKRKMGKATAMAEIQMMRPVIMTANRATKPVPKSNKRKSQESHSGETSDEGEDEAPFAKRTKRSGRFTREPAVPAESAATRSTRSKSLHKKASTNPSAESEPEAETIPTTEVSGRLARVNRRNANKTKTSRDKVAPCGKGQNRRK